MLNITVYRVSDPYGNSVEVAVDDPYDNVQVSLRDKNHTLQFFESESYHLASWAYQHGFKCDRFELEIDLDKRQATWIQHALPQHKRSSE